MKKFGLIFLIWLSMGFTLLCLLSRLELFLPDFGLFFSVMIGVTFFIAVVWSWISFQQTCIRIRQGIETWDEEMKRDVPLFLRTRKFRLLTLLGLMVFLLCAQWVILRMSERTQLQEVFLYVFIIGLFHSSMVATFVFFKLFQTLSWVEHENNLARLEGS